MADLKKDHYSTVSTTGVLGSSWPSGTTYDGHIDPVLTAGFQGKISAAGWTKGNEGFQQQTFLGASISSFNISAGFGDTTTTLDVQLVNDEYNLADGTFLGSGDDVYHSGQGDQFNPPIVGAPVFFKFGKNYADIQQAWRKTYYELYDVFSLPKEKGSKFPIYEKIEKLEKYQYIPIYSGDVNSFGEVIGPNLNDQDVYEKEDQYTVINNNSFSEDNYSDGQYRGARHINLFADVERGWDHFVFGGILNSINHSRGTSNTFRVSVSDPREILSNVTLILNDYQETTFNNKNMINVYGFLEYDPSETLKKRLIENNTRYLTTTELYRDDRPFLPPESDQKNPLFGVLGGIKYNKVKEEGFIFAGDTNPNRVPATGNFLSSLFNKENDHIFASGIDMYNFSPPTFLKPSDINIPDTPPYFMTPEWFPITGQGFSRRCEQGIPFYRVYQALEALFSYNGLMPDEYENAGFGGPIDFRGYKYVVDLSGLPVDKIPIGYFLEYNQMDLLSFIKEITDAISHDYYISLLPIIDSPATLFLYNYNQKKMEQEKYSEIITGIIRVDAVDKTKQPKYGAVKDYIDSLEKRGIVLENQNVGFNLSNETTDRFIAGAQKVDMVAFSANKDRAKNEFIKYKANLDNKYLQAMSEQWSLETSLKQQILPFYGFLGKNAVTIPVGFGAYQQIMLDTTGLDAVGVGNYYVTTEAELRAVSISYDAWRQFLKFYSERYIEIEESPEGGQAMYAPLVNILRDSSDELTFNKQVGNNPRVSVIVPRCVFNSDKPYMNDEGLPASPCSPPYGYPLYYKRLQALGVEGGGYVDIGKTFQSLATRRNKLQAEVDKDPLAVYRKDLEENFGGDYDKLKRKLLSDIRRKYGLSGNGENFGGILSSESGYKDKPRTIREAIKKEVMNVSAVIQDLKNSRSDPKRAEINAIDDWRSRNITSFTESKVKSLAAMKNAQKVYNFLKKAADNLGKKFLVKIPKKSNLNYKMFISPTGLVAGNGSYVDSGPFGFSPVASGASWFKYLSDYGQEPLDIHEMDNEIYHHYLDEITPKERMKFRYRDGALRCSYNLFDGFWEYNYKPEPQGGFFDWSLHTSKNSYTDLALCPKEPSKFVTGGRISPFVRVDNSQFYNFEKISSEDIIQEIQTAKGRVPDFINETDNLGEYDLLNLYPPDQAARIQRDKRSAVAFIRCDVEERLYMPPKIVIEEGLEKKGIKIFGEDYIWPENFNGFDMKQEEEMRVEIKSPILNVFHPGCRDFYDSNSAYNPDLSKEDEDNTQDWRDKQGGYKGNKLARKRYGAFFDFQRVPFFDKFGNSLPNLGYTLGDPPRNILTEDKHLGSDHVYALITLPGAISTNVDAFYLENAKGQNSPIFTASFLHKDTIKYVPSLMTPPPATFISEVNKIKLRIGEKPQNAFGLANPEMKMASQAPSPVYPDMVVLPMMSMERTYGPWISAGSISGDSESPLTGGFPNIGGKVEFIKDEALAPWNYGGYEDMSTAALFKANASNGLLLFAEGGSFTIPDAPFGLNIGKALLDSGPLVTSIAVSISESIKTTISMDLYANSFGKLRKSQEEAFGKLTRDRQKQVDERNALMRKGISKSRNYTENFSAGDAAQKLQENFDNFMSQKANSLESKNTVYTNLVFSADEQDFEVLESGVESQSIELKEKREFYSAVALQHEGYLEQAEDNVDSFNDLNLKRQRTAGDSLNNIFIGFDNSVYNPFMPSVDYNPKSAIQKRTRF